ncbi:16S rRNA (uracil(1498)-N(3))-methyltransferase [Paraburkholderia sp. MMS20-SJTR3]|uniref:Ribosomal RNA small subunit methyltransferase E n=1 Tax=Paraburkholderia sejongensis TaxID=2886946 RepID=A0ABS8JVP0_9BURK|nr:16S rRNA (uracil(1498)-N(3))-methyltransferase [Paraburkholderia sp. MMS20-SJTR3]MCC8393972.1 16S rRNA (uracil(1498)-N(3))-methyltransferase [Paraburkholderia sp. MMS20-SJTR3]
MPRFFVAAPLYPDDVIALPDDVVRHVLVLRLQPGDSLVLFNGEGGAYDAELVEVERRSARARIREFRDVEVEPPYRLTLAQGIAGGDKMDWLIEKAVELGAAGFVPLATARSVVRLAGERAQRRQQHWQGVVRASCEQCGRNRLPQVQPVQEFGAWLERLPREPAAGELRLLLSPRASIGFTALPETPPPAGVTLLIGPEGGLSADEEAAAVERGFTAVGLGPRVLRTETAGIAVLAALAARWGGW